MVTSIMLIMKEENTQKADEIRFALKNTIRDGGSTALYTAYTYYTVNTVFTVYIASTTHTAHTVFTVYSTLRSC